MVLLFVLVITLLADISLGAVVLLRDPKSVFGRAFFGFCVGLGVWTAANFLAGYDDVSYGVNVWANAISYPVALLALLCGALFAWSFVPVALPRIKRRTQHAARVVVVTALILSATPLVAGHVAQGEVGPVFTTGALLWVYIITILGIFAATAYPLWMMVKHGRPRERQQGRLILVGYLLAATGGLTASTVLPALTGNWDVAVAGPPLTIVLACVIAYAIVRHRLFDIRLAVARSLGYGFTLLALAAIYGFVAFGLARVLFRIELSIGAQIYLSVAMSLASISFPVLKQFFDRITNAVFYRDAYDPQELLDKIAKIAVSSLDIGHIVMSSTDAIASRIKVGHVAVVLHEDEDPRFYGTESVNVPPKDAKAIRELAQKVRANTILVDELDEVRHTRLHRLMREYDLSVMVRLVHGAHGSRATLGYIVLGPKRSGNVYTRQDVTVLEATANELVLAIQNALQFEEIRQFNDTLQQKVNDATSQLREANERLRVLDRNKDDFVSMASHQLRTPLTSVKGYLSMVLEGDAGKITALQRKMIEQAFASSERMTYLISDLLNLSRLKTGKFVISASSVSLVELVHQEIAQLHRMAEASGVDMVIDMPDEMPRLQLDETKTRQLIMNLVDNAIYYTPKGGKVTVRLKQTAKTIELRIIDTGIGVPKDEQHKLFTRFYRATNAKRRRPDGTGIGLYMVKKAVVAMGGAVVFESAEGKGSTFGFSFPIKQS